MTSRSKFVETLTPFAGAAAMLSLLLIVPLQMSQIEEFIADHMALIPPRSGRGTTCISSPQAAGPISPMQFRSILCCGTRTSSWPAADLRWDARLIMQNWPDAARLGRQFSVEQWYLGPVDRLQFRLRRGGGRAFRAALRQCEGARPQR